jgi:hypothetical protein
VVAKFRERLTVSKLRWYRFHIDRFNHKKLNLIADKEHYCPQTSNRFAAEENFDAEVGINRGCETIR